MIKGPSTDDLRSCRVVVQHTINEKWKLLVFQINPKTRTHKSCSLVNFYNSKLCLGLIFYISKINQEV